MLCVEVNWLHYNKALFSILQVIIYGGAPASVGVIWNQELNDMVRARRGRSKFWLQKAREHYQISTRPLALVMPNVRMLLGKPFFGKRLELTNRGMSAPGFIDKSNSAAPDVEYSPR